MRNVNHTSGMTGMNIKLAAVVVLLVPAGPLVTADSPQPEPKAAKPIDVYLLGGQSNMQGSGKVADLPADLRKELPHTYFWNGKTFEPLVPGKTNTANRVTTFGPEVGFALGTATADRPVYLIKYHASGMPLHHGFNGGKWVGGDPAPSRRTFYPGEKAGDANTGTLYAAMVKQFQAGVKHLNEQGHTPTVRGFVWMQGEADAKQKESAATYALSLNRLRKRVAEDLKTAPDLPFVFGQVLPHDPPAARFTHRTEIREQMAACDSASKKPEAMKNATMISTDGFPLLPDTVHYDADGQLKLGKAFAAAMKRLQPATPRK